MQSRDRQNVTLKDIAEKTGYSVNTVSRALRGKDDISAATQALIRKTAEEMGHISNTIASSLRSGYTNTIAVILGDISNLHFATMMKEIEEYARSKGYTTILLNTNEDTDQEMQAIQVALSKGVDGILICPTQKNRKNIEYLKSLGKPFVLIGRRYADPDVNYVVCDDELGGYQATKYLLERGHRRILMLHGPMYISSAAERLAGYLRAHREMGVPVLPELVQEVPVIANGCSSVLAEVQRQNIAFSAIFAFSDMLAWDAWSYLHKKGFSIPTQCSIVGFDNIQAVLPIPFHLSSIASRDQKMSTAAVKILLDLIQDTAASAQHAVLPTCIVTGETVCTLKNS